MARSDILDAPYARYLGLDRLFAVQGEVDALHHPDEFQFRTVHLVSELWLRLIETEMTRAAADLDADRVLPAGRLIRRAGTAADLLVEQLSLLETMSPADYHAFRVELGDASGLQSPGYIAVRRTANRLWSAYAEALARSGADLPIVYERHDEPGLAPLHDVAEGLVNLDAAIGRFRQRHLQIALRFLGEDTLGTGGQGIDFLRRTLEHQLFPDLWHVRGEIARRAGARPYGSAG